MISVHEAEGLSLHEIEQFLLAAKEVRFEASQREEFTVGWSACYASRSMHGRDGERGACCGAMSG
jgi:collagenase-like PrtC family protease